MDNYFETDSACEASSSKESDFVCQDFPITISDMCCMFTKQDSGKPLQNLTEVHEPYNST